MAYVVRADIEAEFDDSHLLSALDDDGDGTEDSGLFDALAASVDALVASHADLASQLGLPSLPATFLRYCARIFMCALLLRRRGVVDEMNPFATPEKEIRARLERIESGEIDVKPKSFTMLTTSTTFHRFEDEENPDDAATSTSDSSTSLILPGPDGKSWQLKLKFLSGQPVHYWEEVA
jgi:phage gp36-like protein